MSATELWDEVEQLHEQASVAAGNLDLAARELTNQLTMVPQGASEAYSQVQVGIALCERVATTTARLAYLLGRIEALAEATVRVSDNRRAATHVAADTGEALCEACAVERQAAAIRRGEPAPTFEAPPLGTAPGACPSCGE